MTDNKTTRLRCDHFPCMRGKRYHLYAVPAEGPGSVNRIAAFDTWEDVLMYSTQEFPNSDMTYRKYSTN